jgi:hypothetical protein
MAGFCVHAGIVGFATEVAPGALPRAGDGIMRAWTF